MQLLIQRWAMNGWTVKNIAQFSHSEGQLGELGLQHSSYTTILFEKEDYSYPSFCPICNINVNDMNRHRQWHNSRETPRATAAPEAAPTTPVFGAAPSATVPSAGLSATAREAKTATP